MRKLLLILLFFVAFGAYAQSELKFYYDLNCSSYYNVPKNEPTTLKTGMGGGFSYLYGRKLYIEPGIMFAQHRKQYTKENGEDVKLTAKIKEQMLKVPLHIGLHLFGNERSHCAFRIYLGPTYACSLKSSVKVNNIGDVADKFDFKRSRWGADAGVGLNLYFFFVDVLYEQEFSKYSDDTNKRNMGFQVNAGLRFTLRENASKPKQAKADANQ
ncbi:MAG: outer membrane beta-barrel protein [Paludibacteraceae bacterium]|nr:outer membrane beta-barrel protein [Paludibacteraceae bacterium]MBR6311004.1 outer membrane beta-barrel protein [Paludibacteraceae bacterium]